MKRFVLIAGALMVLFSSRAFAQNDNAFEIASSESGVVSLDAASHIGFGYNLLKSNDFTASGSEEFFVNILNLNVYPTEWFGIEVGVDYKTMNFDSRENAFFLDSDKKIQAGKIADVISSSPEKFRSRFRSNTFSVPVMFKFKAGTTSIGLGVEGDMNLNGRIKNIHVSISGTKIFTPDLETEVQKMDGIARCAAVVCKVPERNDITGIILFVELTEDSPLKKNTDRKVKAYCHDNVSMFLRPDKVIVLDKMPLTSSGKIDYPDLHKQADSYMLKHKPTKINVK